MKTAVILAAGQGTRIWPYAEVRPKAMLPVANKPVIGHSVEALIELGFQKIIVAGHEFADQIKNYFRNTEHVTVIDVGRTKGTAATLEAVREHIDGDRFLVLYGDSLVDKDDLARLIKDQDLDKPSALVTPLGEESSRDWIACSLSNGFIESIVGHPRGRATHRFAAFAFPRSFLHYVQHNSGVFSNIQVGMMPPMEGYLEMSLVDYMNDGGSIPCVEAQGIFVDLDKPWHILMANALMTEKLCAQLYENVLGRGASIHETASIDGYVRLGTNSHIGRNVIIKGSVIVGDNTTIENGAILVGNAVIGNNCYIGNYCYIEHNSAIGHDCVVSHAAEFGGVLMDRVYLYHYMEMSGIIGTNTDIGAATVCGTLRFDDGHTSHVIKGRREYPRHFANAVYIGDYCRTGVNAMLMPGCKIGTYSVIGSGVVLNEDVPNNTYIRVKQELERVPWGPEKYGW